VIYIISGSLHARIDEEACDATAGDAIVVPAGARLRVDNPGPEPIAGWVTTSVGFVGILADGTRLTPPWTR
jgi:mannose-6-phosphate isomerase-like protein (cupin superfamily)